MAKSAEFNMAFQNFRNANRDVFFPIAHLNYPVNMALQLHKNAVQRKYARSYGYCSSILFSNIAYEAIAHVVFTLMEDNQLIDKNPVSYPPAIIALFNSIRKHKPTHKNKLDLCTYYLRAVDHTQKSPSTDTKHGLIPGTQLFKLLPHMPKIKELILYVNHWNLSSQNTPVWLGSFLSFDDLAALSTCLCGNLYFHANWLNRLDTKAKSARNNRQYVSKTNDEVWDEFVDYTGIKHKQLITTHMTAIDEFIDDLIIVIKALFYKSSVKNDDAISSYERLIKRRHVSEGLGLDDYLYRGFRSTNPKV